jgi:hypothetical protein
MTAGNDTQMWMEHRDYVPVLEFAFRARLALPNFH